MEEEFRDRIATVTEQGKRRWVFAKKPKGRFYNYRTIVGIICYALFFSLPFIHVNGKPLFQFNIPDGQFILFGAIFWPQDFFIFGLAMVAFMLFVIVFTMAFGRLFCGWICPQTIFMEMLFRRIEYWIEGDAPAQKLLAKMPWNGEKIRKKTLKHVIFFALSFVIANTFLAYIIGVHELKAIVTAPPSEHPGGFTAMIIFSAVFYSVFAFFREQVCTVVCPYGRLQGVLLDKNSVVVAYDYLRGEPRGKYKKPAKAKHDCGDCNGGCHAKEALSSPPYPPQGGPAFLKADTAPVVDIKAPLEGGRGVTLGDCIDCMQCVHVCPTGIDIRNGTQLECINCTACIDACDFMMEKTGRPKGLIRYASADGIASGKPLRFTGRMRVYSAALAVLTIAITVMLATRAPLSGAIIRTPGMLYQERGTDSVSNLYRIKLVNKTNRDMQLTLRPQTGTIVPVGHPEIHLRPGAQGEGTFFLVLPRTAIRERKTKLTVEVWEGERRITEKGTTFLGPVQ